MTPEPCVSAKTRDDILGLEFDWLAVDQDGHIGLFSTAGGGRAPQAFLANTDLHDTGFDALMGMEARSTLKLRREIKPGLENTWNEVACRGVFAFDSDPNGGPYRLVAAPDRPLNVRHAPDAAAAAACAVVLGHLHFDEIEPDNDVAIEV